jgi:hypothetical protein
VNIITNKFHERRLERMRVIQADFEEKEWLREA